MAATEPYFTGWRTSSYSTAGQECVEVALTERVVGLRDSRNPEGDPLTVQPRAWAAFLAATKLMP